MKIEFEYMEIRFEVGLVFEVYNFKFKFWSQGLQKKI